VHFSRQQSQLTPAISGEKGVAGHRALEHKEPTYVSFVLLLGKDDGRRWVVDGEVCACGLDSWWTGDGRFSMPLWMGGNEERLRAKLRRWQRCGSGELDDGCVGTTNLVSDRELGGAAMVRCRWSSPPSPPLCRPWPPYHPHPPPPASTMEIP
jgi:hypothetical protein